MLSWVWITPLGSPVVPEVYVYVATSLRLIAAERRSRSGCVSASAARPRDSTCSRLSQSSEGASPVGSMTMMCFSLIAEPGYSLS